MRGEESLQEGSLDIWSVKRLFGRQAEEEAPHFLKRHPAGRGMARAITGRSSSGGGTVFSLSEREQSLGSMVLPRVGIDMLVLHRGVPRPGRLRPGREQCYYAVECFGKAL